MKYFAHGLLLCCLCLLPVDLAGAQDAPTLDAYLKQLGYAPVRLELDRDNHLAVRASIKGKKERLLLDTGACITQLDPKLARDLTRFEPGKLDPEDTFLKSTNVSEHVLMDELTLDGVTFTNQPAQVGKVAFEFAPVAEKGRLGWDFFVRNHCIIDCLRSRLYVRSTGLIPDSEAELANSLSRTGFTETRLRLKAGAPATSRAKVNGEELDLAVDVASPWTVLDWDCGQRLKLSLLAKPAHLNLSGVGKLGVHGLQESQVQTLQLGGATLKRVYLGVAELSAWETGGRGKYQGEVQGVLGIETLVAAGALLDFGTGKLWVNPPALR